MTHRPKIIAAAALILAVEIGTALSAPLTVQTETPTVSLETIAFNPRPSRPVWMPAWTTGVPQAFAARAVV